MFGKIAFEALCFMVCAAGLTIPNAAAQTYPAKSIRMICASPPGGTTDYVARLMAQKLGERLGQQVIVDNRAGAGGIIGTETAAKSPADGYTMSLGSMSTHAVNPSYSRQIGYDPIKDFSPVSRVVSTPLLLAVHPSLPARSVKELIALAKAKPGQFSSAANGFGTTPHLAFELFKSMAGIDVVAVQYRGSGASITDLLGGHVQMMMTGIIALLPHTKTGKLRALAVTSPYRSTACPDVPTVAEAGVSNFDVRPWFGVFMPARAPQQVVTLVNSHLRRILELPDVRQRLIDQGADPAGNTPEEFAAFVKSELMRWGKVIKDTGTRID
jgi:tripartite-type tricarboxylate transporter receptor subunit TctC